MSQYAPAEKSRPRPVPSPPRRVDRAPRDVTHDYVSVPAFSRDFSRIPVHAHREVSPTFTSAPIADAVQGHQLVPSEEPGAVPTSGRPLDATLRGFFEPRFGVNLAGVRTHTGRSAADACRAIGAQAFARGGEIFYGADRGPRTDALTAHELTHVIQRREAFTSGGATLGPANGPAERQAQAVARDIHQAPGRIAIDSWARPGGDIQRAIHPEDVAGEMVGRTFELASDHIAGGVTLKAGATVTVTSWTNASVTVSVTAPGIKGQISIPKTLLRPTRAFVSGVDSYGAGVVGQAASVTKGEAQLASWMARKAGFKSPKAGKVFDAERTRLEGLLATRRSALNRKLIQETMFNRFDTVIKREVDAANAAHALKGSAVLDSNLVKSMLFQESELGTSGTHLEVPPTHPVKTRFNLGQVIDSSGAALLTLLEAEHKPLITTFGLSALRKDLATAQAERASLKKKSSRTPAENARLVTLNHQAGQSWETFIWEYKAPHGFAAAVASLFAATTPARNEDFEFWIHMAVMWLFTKHRAGRSWPDAIKAYNGDGARAERYRDAVVKRAVGAAAAATAGKPFIPTR